MIFNSLQFASFFVVFLAVLFILPKQVRVWWILLSSLYFYSSGSIDNLAYLLSSTIVTWICAFVIDLVPNVDFKTKLLRIILLIEALVFDFGMLIYFKYSNFIMETLGASIPNSVRLLFSNSSELILPIGISFFVFTNTGYLFDVYRGKTRAERNLLYFSLFASFFPSIMSGPIERADRLIPQFRKYKDVKLFNSENIISGFSLIVWGLFTKMVIADRISLVVETVYSQYYVYGSIELFLASVAYSIQIYCDFMSYSTIALGCAKMMGISIFDNFDAPYTSESIKEFWRRWHISLSTWLRDYVYIPLGGSRCSKFRKCINIMITFLISGIWHGAGLNFILWGAIHGVLQVIGDIIAPIRAWLYKKTNAKTDGIGYHLTRTIITFLCVNFAWIFFRVSDYRVAFEIIRRIFQKPNWWVLFNDQLYNLGLGRREFNIFFVSFMALTLFDWYKNRRKQNFGDFMNDQPWYFRWVVLLVLLFAILTFGMYGPGYNAAGFIYFDF
ncbi:MAG: MBOAT family protein [Saccharofermentans sp.]|nr:MBOAT family protein [Saccharofermentans sp.]